jgi:hypothetical protein
VAAVSLVGEEARDDRVMMLPMSASMSGIMFASVWPS